MQLPQTKSKENKDRTSTEHNRYTTTDWQLCVFSLHTNKANFSLVKVDNITIFLYMF